ncbi:MAG: MATE family efflux transporter [Spirochaetes bacterium GWF1_41_5]|nr:MAG: MATE family efflux transporter [Spirochaetes bacterium GWF1_41_5]HBE04527.1 MATE family efflux transporter [Spirochaetia bacterium]
MKLDFGSDMTIGSIPKLLLNLSIPMLIGNLFNIGQSVINTIWVGNILGPDAVGATAVTFPLVFILVALAGGSTMATTILVSQFYGAKNNSMVEKVVNNSFTITVFLSILLSLLGIFLADKLLRLMNTPERIFLFASGYLKLSFISFIFMYFSFLISSILRGIGDTRTPLIFMAIATVINIILDPLLIMGIGPFPKLGLNGAAIASLISVFTGFSIGIIYLHKKDHILAINPKKFIFDKDLTFLLFKIGLPTMVQQSLVSVGITVITSLVNTYGPGAIAAFGAAGRIDALALMPAMTMSMAISALTGQNIGARKIERVPEIFKWGIIIAVIISGFISFFAFFIPETLLKLFVHEPDVISIGVNYLKIISPGYIIFSIMFVSNGVINGAGNTFITMIFSLLAVWGIRLPLAFILTKTRLGITGIWIAMLSGFIIVMIASVLYYLSGRWKNSSNKIHAYSADTVSEPEVYD